MRKTFLMLTLLGTGLAAPCWAEVLELPPEPAAAPAPANLPQRGSSQAAVLKTFGEPVEKHAPAGGGHPKQPPITRWDYPGYSVFFERSTVIDVVVKDAPAPIHHMDELQPQP